MFTNPYAELFPTEELSGAMLAFYTLYIGFILVFAAVFGIISYILQSKSMYTIAKRRGIHHPWLAWVPVGNMWMLGCISDQFRALSYGQHTNRRRTLMVLDILVLVILIPLIIAFAGLFDMVFEDPNAYVAVGTASGIVIASLLICGVGIAVSIVQYMCLFDLFRSCNPNRSVLFLILSILISYPLPFFVYACRNKDLGMPPRTTATPEYYN